jgi:hypothetical protein
VGAERSQKILLKTHSRNSWRGSFACGLLLSF